MKRILCIFCAFAFAFMLTGCEGGSTTQQTETGSTPGAAAQTDPGSAEKPEENSTASAHEVDVDLTLLSSTMVYSEVYQMLTAPEKYLGKTVRMNGQFALYSAVDENGEVVPDFNYYACIIADATACCQQGLEFVLEGNAKYPDDYPELGSDITVVGEFHTYMEGEYEYCELIHAVLE